MIVANNIHRMRCSTYVHYEVLLPTVVLFIDCERELGLLASQMTVPVEGYFKDFVIRNCFYHSFDYSF
jgi:hypothetical protein